MSITAKNENVFKKYNTYGQSACSSFFVVTNPRLLLSVIFPSGLAHFIRFSWPHSCPRQLASTRIINDEKISLVIF